MAENTSEIDAINHLLEVEKNAAALISDAAEEADRRLAQARAKYNAESNHGSRESDADFSWSDWCISRSDDSRIE